VPNSCSLIWVLYFKLGSLERLILCSSWADLLPRSAASSLLAMCASLEQRSDAFSFRSEMDSELQPKDARTLNGAADEQLRPCAC